MPASRSMNRLCSTLWEAFVAVRQSKDLLSVIFADEIDVASMVALRSKLATADVWLAVLYQHLYGEWKIRILHAARAIRTLQGALGEALWVSEADASIVGPIRMALGTLAGHLDELQSFLRVFLKFLDVHPGRDSYDAMFVAVQTSALNLELHREQKVRSGLAALASAEGFSAIGEATCLLHQSLSIFAGRLGKVSEDSLCLHAEVLAAVADVYDREGHKPAAMALSQTSAAFFSEGLSLWHSPRHALGQADRYKHLSELCYPPWAVEPAACPETAYVQGMCYVNEHAAKLYEIILDHMSSLQEEHKVMEMYGRPRPWVLRQLQGTLFNASIARTAAKDIELSKKHITTAINLDEPPADDLLFRDFLEAKCKLYAALAGLHRIGGRHEDELRSLSICTDVGMRMVLRWKDRRSAQLLTDTVGGSGMSHEAMTSVCRGILASQRG